MEMIPLTSIKYVKEGMKLNKRFSYIAFNSKDRKEIVKNVLEYTSNFFVLLIKNIAEFENKKIYFCSNENISAVLADIDKGGEPETSADCTIKYDCIIVLLELLENEYAKYDYLKNKAMKECQITYNLLQTVNKGFRYYDFIIQNGYMVILYIQNGVNIESNQITGFSESGCLFVNYKGGIGDYMMNVSLINDFILECGYEKKKTYLMMLDGISQFELAKCFYPDINIVKLPSYMMIRHFMEKTKENRSDITKIYPYNHNDFIDLTELYGKGHIYELNRIRMFMKREIYPFNHYKIMKKRVIDMITPERKKRIDDMFDSKTQYIVYQFFTGDYIHDKKYIGRDTRCWNEENAYNFYGMCIDNNINIVILNSHCYREMKGSIELGKLSIFEYIYAISKFTMVVGIDSSAGHIASFWNIPTLTLWGEQTPLVCEGNDISFRVLRNNYSIVPKNRDINSVTPDIVFETMKKILSNNIILDTEHVITYEDSVNGYNTLFVEIN